VIRDLLAHGRCPTATLYTEPDRQFMLVKEHIVALRQNLRRTLSKVKVYVERNLGFEAEHHHRALGDMPGVEFYAVSLTYAPPKRKPRPLLL